MSGQATSYKTALGQLASDERYSEVLSQGSMSVGIYAPHEKDEPRVHGEDRVYVVLNGSGFFDVDEDRQPFGPGDLLYAGAGSTHSFEGFTPDFAVWAISVRPGG